MKLHDPNILDNSYTYSTSFRFCLPFTFAPFTTVAQYGGNFTKAISFMWHRHSRSHLEKLHDEVRTAVIAHRLALLHRTSVWAFTFPASYKGERGSVAALKFLADDGFSPDGKGFPFSPFVLSCLRSFAPSRLPNADELDKARQFWGKLVPTMPK